MNIANREDRHIRTIGDNKSYFEELTRDGRTPFLIPCKIPENAPPALRALLDSIDAFPHELATEGEFSMWRPLLGTATP